MDQLILLCSGVSALLSILYIETHFNNKPSSLPSRLWYVFTGFIFFLIIYTVAGSFIFKQFSIPHELRTAFALCNIIYFLFALCVIIYKSKKRVQQLGVKKVSKDEPWHFGLVKLIPLIFALPFILYFLALMLA